MSRLRKKASRKQQKMVGNVHKLEKYSAQKLLLIKEQLRQLEEETDRGRRALGEAAERLERERVNWEMLIDTELQCNICSEPFVMVSIDMV